ncbi:MAG TPA: AI-2E family transporter [Longimicrobiales bacterium]|nr:AI-2E family transporter [Longimicrobiales bacterium]
MTETPRPELRWLSLATVLLALGLFLLSVRPVLSPFVLFGALVLLMAPYSGTRYHRVTVVGAGFLLLIWALATTGSLLAPFILAAVLSVMLDPTVDRLERWMPRSAAILLLFIPIIAAVVVLLFFGLPALGGQLRHLIGRLPELIERLADSLYELRARFLASDIRLLADDALLARLRDLDAGDVGAWLEDRQAELGRRAWAGVLGLGKGVGTLLTILAYAVLTPVLAFYLLRDFDTVRGRAMGLFPSDRRAAWTDFLAAYHGLVARYLRGQVIAAAIVGVMTWLGLWALGFPYAGLIGAIAGVFNVVPYLGLIVSLIPALLIALISGAIGASLLKIAVVFGVVQFLDSSVTSPRIVGDSVGIHPVWIMLALALGGYWFGFVGLLLAVPFAALIKLLTPLAIARYRQSAVYRGSADSGEDTT